MKKMKRLAALFLAVVMVLAMGMTAFAEEPQNSSGAKKTTATITIENASKGETYKIYRLFEAKVTGTDGGSIAYTGTIPEGLENYFENKAGNIYAKDAAKDGENMSEGLKTALADWAENATPIENGIIVADGSAIEVTDLPFGYYIVTTTQGNSALTVTSTNPNATIYDKNTTEPSVPDDGKKVSVAGGTPADSVSASIGDTVTYTLKFVTSNYEGNGADAKKINKYIVNDSLPEGLKDFTVTKITIKEGGELKTDSTTEYEDVVIDTNVPQFNLETKKMEIPWVDEDQNSLYRNGVTVEVIYTAVVDSNAVIAGEGNVNTFKLGYTTTDNTTEKNPSQSTDSATVKTYALAIKKVDQKGALLAGAEFRVNGLLTEKDEDGVWHVTGKTADDAGTTMATNADGILVIKGVAAGKYNVTETKAPEGYNQLTEPKEVEAVELAATVKTTTTVIYKDGDGNVVDEEHKVTEETITIPTNNIAASAVVVVNSTGTTLPSTGGIGTTIFYVVGGIMVLGACVLLITKKRMSARD